ncbi:MAG: hypothetical protein AAGH41_07785 [Pseudomonadota bacterium]
MRLFAFALAGLTLASCVTDRLAPVPETGAFSLKYVAIDGDQYLAVQKDGSSHIAQLISADHPNRTAWTRKDWEWYAEELFPQDEIDFDGLRMLRGSNLIPVGLSSPTTARPGQCQQTEETEYAKKQIRTIQSNQSSHVYNSISMVTECVVHAGLSLSQVDAVHQRPNPKRLPTHYETVVDLDANGRPEQRNVRLRNVAKADVLEFAQQETQLSRNQIRQLTYIVDRM